MHVIIFVRIYLKSYLDRNEMYGLYYCWNIIVFLTAPLPILMTLSPFVHKSVFFTVFIRDD